MQNLDHMLGKTSPEKLAGDPILRKALILKLMASDIFIPVEENAEQQAGDSGVSLMAVTVEGLPHVMLFSSKNKLADFTGTGTRFAKAKGDAIFPSLLGQNAILNPGPSGLRLTSADMAEINGMAPIVTLPPQAGCCERPGNVCVPECQN